MKAKEAEVTKSEHVLENAVVTAPVAGRIRSINESGTDQNGREAPYIVIQQAGAYRVKGTLGELQQGGIMAGNRVNILSRTDESQRWTGTVSLVDYENPTQGNSNGAHYYGQSVDEMTASSKYPFYVDLDSTEGLLLGQHVYLELDAGDEPAYISIGSAFLVYEEDGSACVWAENKGKLEKRPVSLGEYHPERDVYEILDGLTEEDFIAVPNPEALRGGRSHHP